MALTRVIGHDENGTRVEEFVPTLYELLQILRERQAAGHPTEAVDNHVGFRFGFFDVETREFFTTGLMRVKALSDKENKKLDWPSVGFTWKDLLRLIRTPEGRAEIFNQP